MKVLTLITALLLVAWCGSLQAEVPPVPPGGLRTIMAGECTDDQSGIAGFCAIQEDRDGNIYVVFSNLRGEIQFIREAKEDGYITHYENPRFNSF